MSVQTSSGTYRGGLSGVVRLLEAMSERERADADVRKAAVDLVQWAGEPDLQEAATVALVRGQVSRIHYAEELKALGWPIPEHLLDDVPEDRRP